MAVAMSIVATSGPYHQPMFSSEDWLEVGDRVFSRRYEFLDQQIGLVIGDGEALVVDSRSTGPQARELIADVRRVTDLAIRQVVNTHWHWDHAFGNHELRPATIWGHDRCRSGLIDRAEEMRASVARSMPALAGDLDAVVVDPPDRVFTESATIDVGGRRVDLLYLGRGHTDADIVAIVPDANVLFAGDLLENDATPWFGDGYPMDWPGTVARLLPYSTGTVVPGHGSVAGIEFVRRQLAEFQAVADLAERVHAGALTRSQALATMPYTWDLAVQPLDRALAQLRGELD
jgi:glyoxylase-like metal-dependent hydrolase (beta-lactamase superfamily II)